MNNRRIRICVKRYCQCYIRNIESDIQASSWVELPPKYKNGQLIVNIKNIDNICFLWCILAYLYPVEDNKNITSKYAMYLPTLCTEGLEFPMEGKYFSKF